jgi:hypothetical protein
VAVRCVGCRPRCWCPAMSGGDPTCWSGAAPCPAPRWCPPAAAGSPARCAPRGTWPDGCRWRMPSSPSTRWPVDGHRAILGFDPDGLLAYRAAAPGARSCRVLDRVVALADRRSESVLETRLRLNLVLGGLPVPDVQYRVHDDYGFVLARVDLAYPSARLAIEYDGDTHFTPNPFPRGPAARPHPGRPGLAHHAPHLRRRRRRPTPHPPARRHPAAGAHAEGDTSPALIL